MSEGPYNVIVSDRLWTVDGPGVFESSPNAYVAGRVQLVANAAYAAGRAAADKELVEALESLALDCEGDHKDTYSEIARTTLAAHRKAQP